MSRKLLIETHTINYTPTVLTENINTENGNMVVEGILATCEVKNGNGRYYSKELWEREMDKYSELIEQRRSMGELDHPESQVINLQNVSHIISGYEWDGNNIIGKIEILPTPAGDILKALVGNGVTVGVSSRGMGSLEENREGVMEVQDDFELLCWDFVSTPSNPGSYMHMIKEGMEVPKYNYTKVNSIIHEILCSKGSCPIT
ncbi:primosomal protein [bacterium]|nr:primosomal protein [bacterium]